MKYINDLLSEYDIYINKTEFIQQQPKVLNVYITLNSYDLIDSNVSFDEEEYTKLIKIIAQQFTEGFEYYIDNGEYNIVKIIFSIIHMRDYIIMNQKITITPTNKTVVSPRKANETI
jgi:hypothetical protein